MSCSTDYRLQTLRHKQQNTNRLGLLLRWIIDDCLIVIAIRCYDAPCYNANLAITQFLRRKLVLPHNFKSINYFTSSVHNGFKVIDIIWLKYLEKLLIELAWHHSDRWTCQSSVKYHESRYDSWFIEIQALRLTPRTSIIRGLRGDFLRLWSSLWRGWTCMTTTIFKKVLTKLWARLSFKRITSRVSKTNHGGTLELDGRSNQNTGTTPRVCRENQSKHWIHTMWDTLNDLLRLFKFPVSPVYAHCRTVAIQIKP